jgi:large subunit ribosomal protein L30
MVDDKAKKTADTKKAKNTEAKKAESAEALGKAAQAPKAEAAQKSSPQKPQKAESSSKSKMPMIRIKQIGSPIRRDPRQEIYLKSLGLGKMNRVRQVVDNPATQGLLNKLRHMVVVVEQ